MKKSLTLILALAMVLSLCACGSNPKKDAAVAAFNKTSAAFNDVADLINGNPGILDAETTAVFADMAALLNGYQNQLEEKADLEDAAYDEMIAWFAEVDQMCSDVKAAINAALAG